MDDRPRRAGIHADRFEERTDPSPSACPGSEREALVGGPEPDRGDEVELPPHLMPDALDRLRLSDPIGQELIGIVTTMGQPQRDAGEMAGQCRRQRVLAVGGEDDGGVERSGCEPPANSCPPRPSLGRPSSSSPATRRWPKRKRRGSGA